MRIPSSFVGGAIIRQAFGCFYSYYSRISNQDGPNTFTLLGPGGCVFFKSLASLYPSVLAKGGPCGFANIYCY